VPHSVPHSVPHPVSHSVFPQCFIQYLSSAREISSVTVETVIEIDLEREIFN